MTAYSKVFMSNIIIRIINIIYIFQLNISTQRVRYKLSFIFGTIYIIAINGDIVYSSMLFYVANHVCNYYIP